MKKLLIALFLIISQHSFAHILYPEQLAPKVPMVSEAQAVDAIRAVINADIDKLRFYVEKLGLDPNFSPNGGHTIFHWLADDTAFNEVSKIKYPAVFTDKMLAAMQYLVDKGANVNKLTGANGFTALSKALAGAVNDGYPQCRAGFIKFLLKNGADPDRGTRSSHSWRVWSPLKFVNPFCGTEALEEYFSYKPDFVRGRCITIKNSMREDQETLTEYLGEGHYTPVTMLYKYLESQNIPTPYLDGPYGNKVNPKWLKFRDKYCPDK